MIGPVRLSQPLGETVTVTVTLFMIQTTYYQSIKGPVFHLHPRLPIASHTVCFPLIYVISEFWNVQLFKETLRPPTLQSLERKDTHSYQTEMPPTVILIRHAEALHNVDNKYSLTSLFYMRALADGVPTRLHYPRP